MRIKSYFAPSVQAAIALARKEFGEGVTLVTSHVASLESRDLGEYEVVFAIEEPAPLLENKPAMAASDTFQNLFQQAIVTPPSPHLNLPEKLELFRSLLVEMGIEPPMVRALITIVERCVPSPVPGKPEPEPEAQVAGPAVTVTQTPVPFTVKPKYNAAEVAFISAVSESAKNKALGSVSTWTAGS
jgi:hypothetical protein